jgi:ATP-dependent DNA ligase
MSWPIDRGILDGELCAATGMEGILGVFDARKGRQAPLAFLAFDVLHVDGHEVMTEPWTDRRKRLEDLAGGLTGPHVAVVPVTGDAAALWATWVGWGGEGIVLKDRHAPYRPGVRSSDWLAVKHQRMVRARIDGGEPALVRWGDWGWAARLTLTYRHPQTRRRVRIVEMVRVPQPESFVLRIGERGEMLCWGFLPNGRLRHPVWLRWVSDPRS